MYGQPVALSSPSPSLNVAITQVTVMETMVSTLTTIAQAISPSDSASSLGNPATATPSPGVTNSETTYPYLVTTVTPQTLTYTSTETVAATSGSFSSGTTTEASSNYATPAPTPVSGSEPEPISSSGSSTMAPQPSGGVSQPAIIGLSVSLSVLAVLAVGSVFFYLFYRLHKQRDLEAAELATARASSRSDERPIQMFLSDPTAQRYHPGEGDQWKNMQRATRSTTLVSSGPRSPLSEKGFKDAMHDSTSEGSRRNLSQTCTLRSEPASPSPWARFTPEELMPVPAQAYHPTVPYGNAYEPHYAHDGTTRDQMGFPVGDSHQHMNAPDNRAYGHYAYGERPSPEYLTNAAYGSPNRPPPAIQNPFRSYSASSETSVGSSALKRKFSPAPLNIVKRSTSAPGPIACAGSGPPPSHGLSNIAETCESADYKLAMRALTLDMLEGRIAPKVEYSPSVYSRPPSGFDYIYR